MNVPASPVALFVVIVVTVVAAAVSASLIRSGSPLLPRKIHRIVSILRILGLAALVVALVNPFLQRSVPDPSAYHVAILGDLSRSMETRDLPTGISRLEWLSSWLAPSSGEPGYRRLVDPETPVSVRLFSTETSSWNGEPIDKPLPGQTAIGEALATLQDGEGSRTTDPLGGVLLLSDGMNLSGMPPVEAARTFAQSGIPVSVIGIGQSTSSGDVSIGFAQNVNTLEEGQEGVVRIDLINTYSDTREGQLTVYQNDRLIAGQAVTLEAGEQISESVAIDPSAPGVDTLRAVFEPRFTGDNPATNTSFSIAEIKRRDHYRFLLIASGGGWSERMLRILAKDNTSFSMDSLIRIDAERYFLNEQPVDPAHVEGAPVQRQTLNGIPEDPEFYRPYDALILDDTVLVDNPGPLNRVLREFTGTRGGGLLLVNSGDSNPQALPAELRTLFPARDVSVGFLQSPLPMQFDGDSLFADYLGGVLFADPAPRIPALSILGQPGQLSRAAQVPVRAQPGNVPVLVTHAYGAGRSAWLGTDSLWKWKLESPRGEARYTAFWEAVLSWLAVGGKDRLKAPVNASIVPMDAPADLDIELLGRDYTPRMDASATALMTGPDGQSRSIRLLPSIDEPGRYVHAEFLQQPGTWRVDYTVLFPDGDELKETAWFAMAATSPESRETAFQEKTLRDIARLTGGVYYSFQDWRELSSLPVSNTIPLVQDRIHWTRTWPFLLAAFAFLVAEWWLRRRHGLR